MSLLDLFALLVLTVVAAAAIAVLVVVAMLPGRIARRRGHPQAEAIAVCGWWGILTFGLLLPIAYIWAYTNPTATTAGARASSGPVSTEAAK